MEKENTMRLQPVKELFNTTWSIYREKLRIIVLMSLWGILPSLLVAILLSIIAAIFSNHPNFLVINNSLAILMTIPLLYISARINIAIYLIISQNLTSVKNAWISAGKYFWSYALTMFWMGMMITLWFVLLVFPGFIFLVFYSMVVWVFFLENYHGYAALKRSKELVSGYWRSMAIRLLALLVPVIIFSIFASVIKNKQVSDFVTSIFDYFFGVFVMIYTYQLYNNLFKIKGHSKIERHNYRPLTYVLVMLAYVLLIVGLYLFVVFTPSSAI